ncbi:MAG TPA: hypothetical protein VGD98_25695 [Ktedonobacteraceae bacterium]
MPSTGTAYDLEVNRRQPLTEQNLQELGIHQFLQEYLANQQSLPEFAVACNEKDEKIKPIGISINEAVFGTFPGTAADRGWISYMTLGEPIIEERGDIKPPAPDTLSSRVYVNRSGTPCEFQDTVDFTVSNTISWSLEGTLQLTLGARTSATLQAMMETRNNLHQQTTMHNEPNSTGTQEDQGKDQSSTSQGTASGTGELSAQLLTGITASASGSLTTSWASHSTISGKVPETTRVATRATQRRVVRQYWYQIPVTFVGRFAAHYPVPVKIKDTEIQPPNGNNYADVIALDIASEKRLLQSGKLFRNMILQGTADDVSTLAVEHTVFEMEKLAPNEQPLQKTK